MKSYLISICSIEDSLAGSKLPSDLTPESVGRVLESVPSELTNTYPLCVTSPLHKD